MAYAITKQGRTRSDQIGDASTRYMGPAPVSMQEYKAVLAEAAKPGTLDLVKVSLALSGIELAPGVMEAVRAAVNSRSSIFIYGAPGNGKTTLARRISSLLGGPIILPVALDVGGGEVMSVFDGAIHRVEPNQPADRRWRRVARPLVQVGGEFQLEMFDPTWEEGSRVYGAPPQALEMIQTMYGGRPTRGNHPRDLLERLVDVSSARGVRPQLTPELIEAAWNTLFVAS